MATVHVWKCKNCNGLIFALQNQTPEEAGEPGSLCRICGRTSDESRLTYLGTTEITITPP